MFQYNICFTTKYSTRSKNRFSFHDKLRPIKHFFFCFDLNNVLGEFSVLILNYFFRTMDKTRAKTYFQQKSEIIFVFTVMNLSNIMNTREQQLIKV